MTYHMPADQLIRQPVRVIITDDHQMFTEGMVSLLEAEPWIEVCGTAPNGMALMELLKQKEADLILMDIHMPEMDGIQATKRLIREMPGIKILMLTMSGEPKLIEQLIKAGAHGYILKNTGKTELLTAIKTLMEGSTYYSQEVARIHLESLRKPPVKPTSQGGSHVAPLTRRERDVLKLIAREHTTAEIAEKLFISQNTVESHRKNLLSKLQLRNSAGLARYAVESGLLEEE